MNIKYQEFTKLRGCTSCKYFPGPYLKDYTIESPIECYDCWDSITECFVNYERKKFIWY